MLWTDGPTDAVESDAFRVYARETSARTIAVLCALGSISMILVWPTDLLLDRGQPGLLRQFAVYRLSVFASAAVIAVITLRSRWLRARPGLVLAGTCALLELLVLLTLAPRISLDYGWMDMQYLWPLVTVPLLVPLRRRVAWTVGMTTALAALSLAFTPSDLGRPFLWVHGVVYALSIGVSVFIGDRVYRLVRRAHETALALEAHNATLAARVSATQDDLRRTYEAIVAERERERTHLSRELHDATGQLLTALRLTLGVMRRADAPGPEDARAYRRVDATLDELFARIHGVLLELRPKVVDDLGLAGALEWLAATTAERRRRPVTALVEEAPSARLDVRTSVALYRIAQRALGLLSNLGRPGAPMSIELHERDRVVVLRIIAEVDGDTTSGRDDAIVEIEERARMLGARHTIRLATPASVTVEYGGASP